MKSAGFVKWVSEMLNSRANVWKMMIIILNTMKKC